MTDPEGAVYDATTGGRPKLSGKRQQAVLATLKREPNLTTIELAEAVDVAPNYLYGMMPRMKELGLVQRQGKLWSVVD